MNRPTLLALCAVIIGVTSLACPIASAPAQTAPSGAQAFNVCRACHTLPKGGKNGLGPNLGGLFGRKAGSVAGFNYSPALKASTLRWDDTSLNEYLASPMKKVPGSRMPISVPDPAKRAAIIAYLRGETNK